MKKIISEINIRGNVKSILAIAGRLDYSFQRQKLVCFKIKLINLIYKMQLPLFIPIFFAELVHSIVLKGPCPTPPKSDIVSIMHSSTKYLQYFVPFTLTNSFIFGPPSRENIINSQVEPNGLLWTIKPPYTICQLMQGTMDYLADQNRYDLCMILTDFKPKVPSPCPTAESSNLSVWFTVRFTILWDCAENPRNDSHEEMALIISPEFARNVTNLTSLIYPLFNFSKIGIEDFLPFSVQQENCNIPQGCPSLPKVEVHKRPSVLNLLAILFILPVLAIAFKVIKKMLKK